MTFFFIGYFAKARCHPGFFYVIGLQDLLKFLALTILKPGGSMLGLPA
jgi:hypothetical protein